VWEQALDQEKALRHKVARAISGARSQLCTQSFLSYITRKLAAVAGLSAHISCFCDWLSFHLRFRMRSESWLRCRAPMENLIDGGNTGHQLHTGHQLPSNRVPNRALLKSIINSIIADKNGRADRPRRTIIVSDILLVM
jgi:hypothetical protein